MGTVDTGRLWIAGVTCKESLYRLRKTYYECQLLETYGRPGSSFRTSAVPFLPKAGRELMLKSPLSRLVEGCGRGLLMGASSLWLIFHIVFPLGRLQMNKVGRSF